MIELSNVAITLGDALFTADIDFEKTWPAKQWRDTTHFHGDSEIHIILDGTALIEIDGKDVRMEKGDMCLLAPRSSHYPKLCSENLVKLNFSFRLTKNQSHGREERSFSEYAYYSGIFKSVSEYFVLNDAELLSTVIKLVSEPFTNENEHIYRAHLAVFFITLAARIKEHNNPQSENSLRGTLESENSFRQRKIVEDFFSKRYAEQIRIEDLAGELCISVPHTHRIVKKFFDGGFKKNLMKQRIEHACMLIKRRDLPLSEIAYLSGYTSYNGFLSAFKSYMGKTPKEYEKTLG